ncbi:MAG: M14 family zinc carboxypeptidase, partial [Candidatus Hydrogenedentes bacterium]|nr:M14 family zinc carboxypeptidase [Candidatus Hydrogenedentota bacterium]
TLHATPNEIAVLSRLGYSVVLVGTADRSPIGKANRKGLGAYKDYNALTDMLEAYASDFPAIARLYTLGQSVQGRELWVMRVSDNPDNEEDEPEFKYVADMHGDETVGGELCLYFIDLLLKEYGVSQRITDLVDSTEIWIVPRMNPDGFEAVRRENASGFDLNRSFPVFPADFDGTLFDGAPLADASRPVETAHVMRWTVDNSFVLSANFHGGALLVNYPYDNVPGIASGSNAPSPDDALCQELSLRYSTANPPMFNSAEFARGISNGSAWFSILGGMQDWNYRYAGCLEVTLEVSNAKIPVEATLSDFWGDNQESMLAYLESVHIGVRGLVTDRKSGEPLWAKVAVESNEQPVFSDPDVGDYHRLLLPGAYSLTLSATGYIAWTESGVTVGEGGATRVDVALSDGDIDEDGLVAATDAQQVVNALNGETGGFNRDVDGGGVGATDLQAVVDAVLEFDTALGNG